MARSSTTFTRETAPKGKGSSKRAKTRIKEALGVQTWNELIAWVEGQGIEKCIEEIQKLKGKDYVYAYSTIIEYVKPKLARTTVAGDPNAPIQQNVTHEVVFKDYADEED